MAGEGGYERRKPEETVLYEAMRQGWAELDVQVPRQVREEVRRYFECGQLRYGFVEVQCEEGRAVTLVAFSCRARGWCPSCTTRRAIEAGAHAEVRLPMVSDSERARRGGGRQPEEAEDGAPPRA